MGLHPWTDHSANLRCDSPYCLLCHPHVFTGCEVIARSARCSCGLTYGELCDATADEGDKT